MDKDEGKWAVADWAQAENVDAPIADIQWHIKLECHATSKPALNVALKW